MKCSPFDLKDYFLKELTVPQAAQMEEHIHTCPGCREDLDRLRLTEAALFSLRDEEIPQRIAFVSDKIFEPSPMRRLWAAFWGSSGRLGFASAAMLSAALVFFSVHKPAPALVPDRAAVQPLQAPGPTAEEIQTRVDKAIAVALDKALTESKQTTQLIADLRRENELAHSQLVRVAGDLEMARRHELNQKRYSAKVAESGDQQ
jgi:anti-sigma factor RsiW